MEITRTFGIADSIYFPLIDAGAADFEATPVTHASGDSQISIDGGAFANTTNAFAHEGKGIYSIALTAAELSGTTIVVVIVDQGTKAYEDQAVIISTRLGPWAEGGKSIIICEVDTATEAASTTTCEAFRIAPNTTEETTTSHYNGRLITWTSGVLLGQQTAISAYIIQNSKERFTFDATTEAPGDADRFVIT